jgi:hypothetical protein
MAEQSAHDDHQLPKDIRSKLLRFDGDHTIDEFRYGELPADKKQIRLLRLLPGVLDNPQVDCEMFEAEFIQFKEKHKLVKVTKPPIAKPETKRQAKSHQSVKSSNPPTAYSWWLQQLPPAKEQPEKDTREIIHYEALSWRWGDETHGPYAVMILKDGALYKKKVSETLGLAMKYLRSETKERIIWIDAICINQNDHEERSSQVAMMSLLYSGADQVCVWIGDDDEESKIAIKFIANEINQLKNFDRLCTDREHASKWRALLGLMQRAWFSRRWVVQEIALAPNATVYCGPDEIPWHELAIAVELFVEVETATHRLSELMKKDDKFLIPNWFEHISELGASLLVNATARIFREYREGHGESSPKHVQPRRSLLSLEYLVTSLSIFDCGRPHDSVYALVAIARDAAPFPPTSITERTKEALIAEVFSNELEQKPYPLDYNLPYADVCKDFTLFCIQRCADTDPVQALDILCRPWAKDWRPGEFIPHDPPTEPKKERLMQQQTPDDVLKNYWKEVIENPELGVRSASIVRRWFPTREAQDAAKERRDSAEAVNDPDKTKWHGKRKRQKVHHLPEDAVPEIQELGLPSWVARITGAPFDIFPHPGMDMVKMGRKNADPLVGIPQDGHRNYSAGQSNEVDLKTLKFRRRARLGHYSLYVNGFRFDKVAEVAQVSQAGQIPASWLDMAKWEKARRPKSMDADPGDPPDEFWRTLVADRGRHDRNPPYYYARACKETIMKGGLRSNAVDTGALIYNERNSIIAEFCRRVQAVIWNRALIRTEKGILGLASEHVRKGDLICIIYGCTVPIILRKGNLKTAKERHMESIEDSVEAMHRVMRRCEKFRARKAHYMKKSEEEKQQIRKDLSQHKDEILHAEPNHFASRRKSWYNKRRAQSADRQEEDEEAQGGEYIPGSEDNSSEDDSEESESDSDDSDDGAKEMENGVDKAGDKVNGVANDNSGAEGPDSPVNKESRQKKANQRDPYRHYEFLGQAYIHGMMDGEAVRQKFYANKPDHVFEIR